MSTIEDGGGQSLQKYEVATSVVHPAFPKHRMFRRTDQIRLSVTQWRTTICQWDLEGASVASREQMHLHPDFAIGVVKAV